MIFYLEENRIFVLETENTHYVFGIDPAGYNRHLHWGAKCDPADYAFTEIGDENSNHSMLDEYRQELTPFGSTVYRTCDLKAQFADGCREVALRYTGYRLEDDTLRVAFEDAYYPLQVRLVYQVYPGLDIIKRWVEVENTGSAPISFERLFSAGFSLPGMDPYTFENTNGAWGGEFLPCRTVLDGGNLVYESHRGASNHNQSPYFIAHRGATETRGAVYFGSLAYSGNFKVIAGRDLYGITRVSLGMNDFDFSHNLEPGAHLETPPVYCGKTEGLGEMSRQMNRFCLEHLLPSRFRAETLPVLYNSWEATEFNVNVADQTRLAEIAAGIGVELFVMDDGWFGARNNDRAGLGDWFVNPAKFPGGLDELIGNVNALGMDFGLWVEPEMVNPDSDLYRAHPDWTYHFPHRHADELRHQLVLNMTRSDALAQAKPIEDEQRWQNRLTELRNKIRALGTVNLAAIEEYGEVEGRYRFLKVQSDDVERSRTELLGLIRELTAQMRQLFSESFEKINQNFRQIFTELFVGGQGNLVLTDPDNILESGIEIHVQPPGKIIKNLSALSGGEKAFVAIAIYFAILKVKPSPFCMLDEIEAALDEVNVTRYARYLKTLSDKTQFIAITHRRGTMEEADILYGVTMQEKGVSRLLQLDVSQLESRLGIRS